MNLIWIVVDSLRADYLGCYGNNWVKTPYIDKLAKEGVLFENAYIEGFPTIPARYVFFTGKYAIPFHGWEPLKPGDVTIAQILGRRGSFAVPTLGVEDYICAFITDTYHLFKLNYHRGFHSFIWIRGQEFDNYNTDPSIGPGELKRHMTPRWEALEKRWARPREWFYQYYRNVADRECEEDYFPARVVRESIKWLERNYKHEKFFLYVDIFDPHEPWDPPEYYYDMYKPPRYNGPIPIWAGFMSPFPEDYSDEELEAMKAAYAGEVTMVDYWIGRLLEKIDNLGLSDETLVVLTSDHGTAHGEHGFIGKTPCGYREVNRIPLIIRCPGGPRGLRVSQPVWAPDLMPTLLDILSIKVEVEIHGRSFWPMVLGEEERYREFVVCGSGGALKAGKKSVPFGSLGHLPPELRRRVIAMNARELYLFDGEWSFMYAPTVGNELYNVASDPMETENLVSEYPEKAEEMLSRVKRYLEEVSLLKP